MCLLCIQSNSKDQNTIEKNWLFEEPELFEESCYFEKSMQADEEDEVRELFWEDAEDIYMDDFSGPRPLRFMNLQKRESPELEKSAFVNNLFKIAKYIFFELKCDVIADKIAKLFKK